MNLTRFGLHQAPFPATPDTASYYPATGHEESLAELLQAIEASEGLHLLSGEAGTGKTLLCHCLLERLPQGDAVAFLTNSHAAGPRDLLQALLYDLSLPYACGSEQELRLRLTDSLLQGFTSGRQTLLIVDEAQNLKPAALEELRLLENLEAGRRKAVQVLLVAQPSLLSKLEESGLKSLNQRLALRVHLEPLDLDEAVDYMLHQIRIAGGRPHALFTEEALRILARAADGVPRLLNQAGRRALQLSARLEADRVDAEVALEVLTALGWEAKEEPVSPPKPDRLGDGNLLEAERDVVAYQLFDSPKRPA